MALPSTYQLQHSLPNRSPSHRPRSLSLSEYQPINFDREALESAYQTSLNIPSSSISYRSSMSMSLTSLGGNVSSDTHSSDPTTGGSSLSQHLRSGDNPHSQAIKPPQPINNFAGVGAGHTLTPPSSPFHVAAQHVQQQALLPHDPLSPLPPTPPARPSDLPSSTFLPRSSVVPPPLPQRVQPPPIVMRRSQSDTHVNREQSWQGQHEWIEGDGNGRGKRRALPAVPSNLPIPEPPPWEPDYKPQIPPDLTSASAAYAYSSLSAPPPNLPPRRGQSSQAAAQIRPPPLLQTNTYASTSSGAGGPGASSYAESSSNGHSASLVQPPPSGPPNFPPTQTSDVIPQRPPRNAEREVLLRSTDRTPIWSTHYLDPSLRESMVQIPHHVGNITNAALSGLSSAKYEGLARAAKDWAISPDGRFVSEHGGVELGLGVINSGRTSVGWGQGKGRRRARVEIVSKTGGIKLDVIEIDNDRQLDLRIDTRSGDVLVLLPVDFHGPIHITCYNRAPEFLPTLSTQLAALSNPYATMYSTFMTSTTSGQNGGSAGYISSREGEHSKLNIRSEKGRVVLGLRESRDEDESKGLGLKVGVTDGGKKGKKRWWLP